MKREIQQRPRKELSLAPTRTEESGKRLDHVQGRYDEFGIWLGVCVNSGEMDLWDGDA